MSLAADADVLRGGGQALALARAAFAGRGCFFPTWTLPPDFARVPFTFGEAEVERKQRLALLGRRTTEDTEETEDTEKGRVRIKDPETPSPPASVLSQSSVPSVVHPSSIAGLVPTPVGEPQGLDAIGVFAACRRACPAAHLVVDLELLGHKLGQLCLAFGADTIMGSIVDQRPLRLGERSSSTELTRDEAAQMLRAAGFVACERLPDGEVRER